MRAGALSAEAWSFAGVHPSSRREDAVAGESAPSPLVAWDAEAFAEDQIRGLVRQAFSPALNPPVQQVVFSAIEPETDLQNLCRWVGEVLAREKLGEVAIIDESKVLPPERSSCNADAELQYRDGARPMRDFATKIQDNFWSVRAADPVDGSSLCARMADLRREFEYSIVTAPPALFSRTLEMARFADGIILVLSAQRTRRVTALRVKNALAQARLLGTVLSDREFPIPASLYRRL